LIEVVVAMLLLLPLFVAMYLMWAWQDARHAALVAARYAAFEAALGDRAASGSQVQQALRQHVLDGRQRGWFALDSAGTSLVDDAGIRVEVQRWELPGSLARVETAAFDLLAPARALGSGVLDLQRGGAIRSAVNLPARAVLLPSGRDRVQGPRIAASLSLLADPWRAGSAEVARARVAALSASGGMGEWVEPLRGVRPALVLIEPAFERLCLGRIDVDVVPMDRLVGSTGGPADLRQRPCP
jgi:hypothetical protein